MTDVNALDLEELLKHDLSRKKLESILDLVAQASWWVNPIVYQSIQVVYPKTRRKRGKEKRGQIIDGIRLWNNEPAQKAIWLALDKKKEQINNSHVCHIYKNSVPDPTHFTNLANMIILPKCLASLSEWEPITKILKYHSYKTYGYTGPENNIPSVPPYYPDSWGYVSNPNQEDIKRIIEKLKDQSIKRPTYRTKDNL